MKKGALFFLLIFAITKIYTQNYQIFFIGVGASTTVDSVKIENLTQCTDTIIGGKDTLHLVGTSSINELNIGTDNMLNIYPNPINGDCSVGFNAIAQGNTTIKLYDINGKIILQVQDLLSRGHQTYRLSGINSGVYLLRIESDKYFYTSKIISSNTSISVAEIKHIETTLFVDKQTTASNSGKISNFKGNKSLIDMPYTTGNVLKLTGISGNYRTIFKLIPIQNQSVTFEFVACVDADGNNYAVVQIGTQLWMAENLKTSKYNNGTLIPNVKDNIEWANLTSGARCYYNNDSVSWASEYGVMYNRFALDLDMVAPNGWHTPSDAEWTILSDYLGGESVTGGKLKENCTTIWQSPNTGATNETGFTALPGGIRDNYGAFYFMGSHGYFWSTTEGGGPGVYVRRLFFDDSKIYKGNYYKVDGITVRCVKNY